MAAAQETSAPPTIPDKHPGRVSQVKAPSSMKRTGLVSEYLDIWEHATLLYHGFEWQSAAEIFLTLSGQIDNEIERTLCLLNAAIIFARLDDFATASHILDEVEPEEELLPFATFISGHVEFEQGNYEKSEDLFRIALSTLGGPSRSYDRYGLAFTLKASHIQQSLRTLETKGDLFGVVGSVGALPADGVFEAPTRPFARSPTTPAFSRTSSSSDDVPTLSDGFSPASITSSPVGRHSEDASSDTWWYANRGDAAATISNECDFGFEDGNVHQKTKPYPLSLNSDPTVIGSLVRSLAQNPAPTIAPPRRKSRRTLVPREARIQDNITSPLATFIRQLPSQNVLEPRSPTLDAAPTSDLAKFLKSSGPQDSPQPSSARHSASNQSAPSSGNRKVDSISSADLVAEEALMQRSQEQDTPEPPPGQPRHPYRSGVGSLLLNEYSASSTSGGRTKPSVRRTDSIEFTRMDTDSLHSFLCQSTSDRQSARSFVFTDEVSTYSGSVYSRSSSSPSRIGSRPVSMTAVHPALRPDIPTRTTSSPQRTPSPLPRAVEPASPTPTTSVVASTNYSNLKPAPVNTVVTEEIGYSRFL